MSDDAMTAAERDGPEGPSQPLRRDMENRQLAGVLAGVANRLDVDPLLVRIGFVLIAILTAGAAVAAYAIAWIAIPKDGAEEPAGRRPRLTANTRVAAGVGFLTLALLLVMREIGLWWSDLVIWPSILAAAGAALLWRQSRTIAGDEAAPAATTGEVLRSAPGAPVARTPAQRSESVKSLYRGGFGVALIAGAALIVLSATGALEGAKDAIIVTVVVILALALCLAPFWWRLGRNLASERSERIRSQERAEVAAHLHDSVLQTLTLVQKRADDPREVAQLARRQERELREWLFDAERKQPGTSLAEELEDAAVQVEEAHRVPIDVIAVGDARVGERGEAVVAAAREAMVNAAKFAPDAGEIAVYAELGNGRAQVFVRDRGAGFDLGDIPSDRKGVRESIIGRMERSGGSARIRSAPGTGTEVELEMNLEES
jgi:signal transduction histidine kinase/phage shock protein PspC (stress-responsive transcriptional regulator)